MFTNFASGYDAAAGVVARGGRRDVEDGRGFFLALGTRLTASFYHRTTGDPAAAGSIST